MSLEEVRRQLVGLGWDDQSGAVVFVDPGRDPARSPSHRWVVTENRGGAVLVGGSDRGEFAVYDLFHDDGEAARVLDGLLRPDPPPQPDDLDSLRARAQTADRELRAATSRVTVDQLAVGTPLDHIGNASGHYLYLLDTPFPLRSAPPTDLNEPRTGYLIARTLPSSITMQVAPAWFGQPGGGLLVRLDRVIAVYVDQGYLTPFSVTG